MRCGLITENHFISFKKILLREDLRIMKNLKKVLALVVALTMVLGTVAFAAFTDVAVEDDEFTAVSTLSSLGILNGYEDGSFKPDGDITRAEFCTVVCKALGYEAAAGATIFSDVPADHWAAGYINTCNGAKIVSGMGDGTFAPNANVTYEQAVKMLVVALGYEPMAAQKGGWPTGYMVVANTYGMTKGVSVANQAAAATRGVVAQLVYNALDIPMMEQTGFGTNTEYTILDGTKDKDYKTLLTGLDVAKLEGSVNGTAKYGATCEADEVDFRIKEANDNEYFEDKLYDSDEDYYDATLKVAEGINVDDYFGVASIVYAKEYKKNAYEVIAIMPGEESTIVELAIEDIDEVTDEAIKYYASESATKTSTYKLADEITMYVNYADADNFADFVEDAIEKNKDVEITLIENSGDNKFDVIVIKEYAYDRVDTIEEDDTAFTTVNGEDFEFDFDDEDVDVSIVNKDGEEIEFAEIKEDDVIAYIIDEENSDPAWYEIIVLGESAVTGAVNEVKNDAVYVDGTKYLYVAEGINLGDEGTFFLTRTGKIFDYEKDASVASNYAIVLDTGVSGDDFGEGFQVKLLTKNNEVIIYSLRDNLLDNAALIKDLEDLATDAGADIKGDVADRIITFKLDSKNNIREIEFVAPTAFADGSEYDADGESIGKVDVPADVLIFNVDANSIDSVYATDANYLVNEAKYNGYYLENDREEVDCIIITEGGSAIDFAQDLAIVAETTEISINEGADEALKIRYYVSEEDELKELVVTADPDVTELVDTNYADITVGDAFMFTASAEGTAVAFAIVANYDDAKGIYVLNDKVADDIAADENAETEFVVDYIKEWKPVSAGIKIKMVSDDEYTVKAAANQYTYEERGSKTIINVGSWKKGKVDEAEDGFANCVLIRLTNGKVADIISVSDAVAIAE
jgi:hypothetical protein